MNVISSEEVPDIWLDSEDVVLIISLCRIGIATPRQLSFMTGDFSGGISARLQWMLQKQIVVQFGTQGDEIAYSATAEGLVCAFLHDSSLRALQFLRKWNELDYSGLSVRQKNGLSEISLDK